MGTTAKVASSLLLFFLVFGMSATADTSHIRRQVRNRKAILSGAFVQFVFLPLVGFSVVKILKADAPLGIPLLVITTSPGGTYSNWWCSVFNADLALSVTMTAISTILSTGMLPLNLTIYAESTFNDDVVKSLDWGALYLTVGIVVAAIISGVICSAYVGSHRFNRLANTFGNLAGITLITYSAIVTFRAHNAAIWNQHASFYIGVAIPPILGLAAATLITSKVGLERPERISVAIESSFQNSGIAATVGFAMFSNSDDEATAVGVPLYYGSITGIIMGLYCLLFWKLGYTKAPPGDSIFKVITSSYEVKEAEKEEEDEASRALSERSLPPNVSSATAMEVTMAVSA